MIEKEKGISTTPIIFGLIIGLILGKTVSTTVGLIICGILLIPILAFICWLFFPEIKNSIRNKRDKQ